MSDWFSSITNQAQEYAEQAKRMADNLADNIVAQAEAAQNEIDEERMKLCEEQGTTRFPRTNSHMLPWETSDEDLSILSQALMEKVLSLSLCDRNFTEKPVDGVSEEPFSLRDFAPIIMKMLELDSNLGNMHAKVSPTMNEEVFWRNYYQRIQYLRKKSGIDGEDAQKSVKQIDEDSVIFQFEILTAANEVAGEGCVKDENKEPTEVSKGEGDETSEEKEAAKRREAELILQQEVEAELDDDIDIDLEDLCMDDNDDDDDVDIDHLDDLDEIDAALEAQIAKELAEDLSDSD